MTSPSSEHGSPSFSFEPLHLRHLPLLHQWLQEPHVRAFWDDGDRTLEQVERHYFSRSDEGVKSWMVRSNNVPFAYLQVYEVNKDHPFAPWRSKKYPVTFGLDFFIGEPSFLGKKLAAPLIEALMEQVLKPHLPYRLLVDPQVENIKANHLFTHHLQFRHVGDIHHQGKHFHLLKRDASDRTVQMVDYNPKWPVIFEKESAIIHKALGSHCVAVHHFGSTAVPGLCAKPKVDILAVVSSFAKIDNHSLVHAGYEPRGEVIVDDLLFVKDAPTVNLHIVVEGNPAIGRHLKFRDWLRGHSEDRDAYGNLKKALAVQFNEHNGLAYAEAKTPFIQAVLAKCVKSDILEK